MPEFYLKDYFKSFTKNFIGKPITQTHEDQLLSARRMLLEYLRMRDIDYLFNINSEKTVFEWRAIKEILGILEELDFLIEQHDRAFGKPVDSINENLRNEMESFSPEYKEKKIL